MKINIVIFSTLLSLLCMVNAMPKWLKRGGRDSNSKAQSLVTYNAYLMDIGNRQERLPKVISSLEREDADVLCLQEIWFEADMRKIVEELSDKYPSSWSLIHSDQGVLQRAADQSPEAACDIEKFYGLLECMQASCGHIRNYWEYAGCVVTMCPYAEIVGERCQELLVIECKDYRTADETIGCGLGLTDASHNVAQTWLDPSEPIPATAGLLMLSKKPMSNLRRGLYYDTGVIPRGYISAEIEGLGEVVCTHLTSNSPVYQDITSGFSSYEEQNAYEMKKLLESYNHDAIIMGDLNVSPSMPEQNIAGDFTNQMATIAAYNFTSMTERTKSCTYCAEDHLVKQQGYTESWMLDHILLKNDSPRQISDVSIVFNQNPATALSDHYGVKVVLA